MFILIIFYSMLNDKVKFQLCLEIVKHKYLT